MGNKSRDAENRRVFNAFRKFAQKVIMDKAVQATYLDKARTGKLHPSDMKMFSHYGAGPEPNDGQEGTVAIPVRVEHVYADEKTDK